MNSIEKAEMWIGADATYELSLYAGLPLFASVVLLCSLGCVLLGVGAYYLYFGGQGRVLSALLVKDALNSFRWPLWALGATAVFLITNHLIIRGLAVGIWDADAQYYPYQVLVADYARAGGFLQWDPWSNAGLPNAGDPQVGAFSPVNFLVGFAMGGTSFGFKFYWLLMWWLGGLGMFMLARHFNTPPWGGCVVALGFLFCGVYTGHAEHTSFITAFSFLPLVIWRLDSALCARTLRPATEAGALWGLSALAGYPGLTIITGCFAALWALGRWLFAESAAGPCVSGRSDSVTGDEKRSSLWFSVCALAIVLIVGLLVLSPTYVAFFFEGAGTHTRVGSLSREEAIQRNALHPGALSTFASPYLPLLKLNDQMSGRNILWPYTDVSSSSIYLGASVPVFALLALFTRPRDGWRWWLVCLGGITLACALAQTLPLREWLYDSLYPMRFFRHAAIFRFYFVFMVAVLALIATRDLATGIREPADHVWAQFVGISVCAAVSALLVFLAFADSIPIPVKLVTILGYTHGLWVWLGVCGVALVGWLLPHWREWRIPALIVVLAASDAFLTGTLSRQTMINTRPEYLKRWKNLDRKHSASLDLTAHGLVREENSCYPDPPCQYRNNDQMITKTPVFNAYVTARNDFHREMVNHPVLKRIAVGADRIWFSEEVAHVAATQGHFAAFLRRAEELGTPPFVVHAPEELLRRTEENASPDGDTHQFVRIGELPPAKRISVDLEKYLPDELIFTVKHPTEGWLLVTDRWGRNWRAEVNGKETRVYGGNFIFRALQMPGGQSRIRFTYRPFGFPWLIILSWGTLAVVGIWSIIHARCRIQRVPVLLKFVTFAC